MLTPNLYVLDASVLIDLDNSDLLGMFLSLAFDVALPNLILDEFAPNGSDVLAPPDAEIVDFSLAQLGDVLVLQSVHGGLSLPDSAALFLARERDAVLLTGDGALRSAAIVEKVPVHGALWVLDALLAAALIDTERACTALDTMLVKGARLPARDCHLRFSNWGCMR